jgi:hypothetical protein
MSSARIGPLGWRRSQRPEAVETIREPGMAGSMHAASVQVRQWCDERSAVRLFMFMGISCARALLSVETETAETTHRSGIGTVGQPIAG